MQNSHPRQVIIYFYIDYFSLIFYIPNLYLQTYIIYYCVLSLLNLCLYIFRFLNSNYNRGTQKDGSPPQPDDNEEQHVLIVGETEENVNKAQYLVEKVLFADDFTRNRIKEEQLKASQEMRTELFLRNCSIYSKVPGLTDSQGRPIPQEIDDSLMTPYGPPDRNARILPVPNDCVGLIIGKNGETIRRLHRETACKIQVINF